MNEVLQKSLQLDLSAFQIDLAKVTREIKEAGAEKDRKTSELKALQLRVDTEHKRLLQILDEQERNRKAGEDIKTALQKSIDDLKEFMQRDTIAFERNRDENAKALVELVDRIYNAQAELDSWVKRIEETSHIFRVISKNLDDMRAELSSISKAAEIKRVELEEMQRSLIATLDECNRVHAKRLELENEMPAILKMKEDNMALEKDLKERDKINRLMERRLKPEYLKVFKKAANISG